MSVEQNIWEIKNAIDKHKHKRRAEVVTFLLELQSNDLVLDVGCSEGYITSFFADQAGFVVGASAPLSRATLYVPSSDPSSTNTFILIDGFEEVMFSRIFVRDSSSLRAGITIPIFFRIIVHNLQQFTRVHFTKNHFTLNLKFSPFPILAANICSFQI